MAWSGYVNHIAHGVKSMNQELDKKLVKDFPNLYADRYGDMRGTCMCWGFPGDGWEKLIRELSEKLEKEIVELKQKYPDSEYPPRASQVKEKFGVLRFYMSGYTDSMKEAIGEACKKSWVTCEDCGNPGKLRNMGGWYYTRCDTCWEELKKSYGYKEPGFFATLWDHIIYWVVDEFWWKVKSLFKK